MALSINPLRPRFALIYHVLDEHPESAQSSQKLYKKLLAVGEQKYVVKYLSLRE